MTYPQNHDGDHSLDQSDKTGRELMSFIERIEHVEAEMAELQVDRKEIYAELKGRGFDAATVRTVIKLRKQDPDQRAEKEALLDMYMAAIGDV